MKTFVQEVWRKYRIAVSLILLAIAASLIVALNAGEGIIETAERDAAALAFVIVAAVAYLPSIIAFRRRHRIAG